MSMCINDVSDVMSQSSFLDFNFAKPEKESEELRDNNHMRSVCIVKSLNFRMMMRKKILTA